MVDRFAPKISNSSWPPLKASVSGAWVRYSDYAALSAENTRLTVELEKTANIHLPAATVEAILQGQRSMTAAFENLKRAEAAEQALADEQRERLEVSRKWRSQFDDMQLRAIQAEQALTDLRAEVLEMIEPIINDALIAGYWLTLPKFHELSTLRDKLKKGK